MMTAEKPPRRSKAVPIAIAIAGIVIELIGIALISSKQISPAAGTPLIIVGMFMAFVPLFVLARRARPR